MTLRVDTLIVGANVRTMDPRLPRADSLAVLGGRVVAVGRGLDLAADRVIDLRGGTVVPGFHDAHQHMMWFGRMLLELDVRPSVTPSLAELYEAVRDRARTAREGEWITGGGYDQNAFGGRHPTAQELEAIAPGVPVWLRHTSGHMGVASAALLARLGLGAESEIRGGRVERGADGRPTGLLQEGATSLVQDLLFPYRQHEMQAALRRATAVYAEQGITAVTECGVGGGWIGHAGDELAAYQALADTGELLQRVTAMPIADVLHPVAARPRPIARGLDLGLRTGFGDDRLRLGAMKIFTDGSLIGHTAAMCHDFSDDNGNRGYLQADADELVDIIVEAHRAGWQVAAHAIGDRAVDLVLDAFVRTGAWPRTGPPHRIEHCAVTSEAQIARIAALGVIPVPQGSLVRDAGDAMLGSLGAERAEGCYRMRSFLDAGVTVPASTDRPVVDGNPLRNLHALVTRRTSGGGRLAPEEAVSVEEALFAYTVGSATAAGVADRVGMIRPGMLADLTVLDADPCAVDVEEIPAIAVRATLVGGEATYGAERLED